MVEIVEETPRYEMSTYDQVERVALGAFKGFLASTGVLIIWDTPNLAAEFVQRIEQTKTVISASSPPPTFSQAKEVWEVGSGLGLVATGLALYIRFRRFKKGLGKFIDEQALVFRESLPPTLPAKHSYPEIEDI
jgi:hypothetical protein